MAQATATLTVLPFPSGIENSQRRVHVLGNVAVTVSPATYAAGGIGAPTTLNWTGMLESSTNQAVLLNTNKTTPLMAYFTSAGGSGYVYSWNQANNKLQIFTGATAQSPLTELTNAAAIPAAVSSDVIVFEAEFLRATL